MNIDRDAYLRHISDLDEISEMKRIIDKIEIVLRDHSIETTDFLDPHIRDLAISILNRFLDISYSVVGGIKEAERKVIIIYPDYHYLTKEEYTIGALRITGDLDDLDHKDFLGSVLGLGITRDKLGDILVHRDFVDIVIKKEIRDFILFNLKKVSNRNVLLKPVLLDDLRPVEAKYKEIYRSLSSKRLDVYISGAYNLSRRESSDLIASGRAKVNWALVDNPAYEIEEGDLISLRGYGRSSLYELGGLSRKNKIHSKIRLLI